MTVNDLITSSLLLIGAVGTGETPSAADTADGLSCLNDLLGSWSTESLLPYKSVREVFALVGSQQTYTMGTGGNFDTVRPTKITSAAFLTNSFEMPISVITAQEWSSITNKSLLSSRPTDLYAEGTSPLETINIYPIPNIAGSLVIYSQKAFVEFASLTDSVVLPPGYSRALKYNLAMELAPYYGKDPSAVIVQNATSSKSSIKRQNTRSSLMVSDASGLTSGKRGFNILTGE